MAYAVIIEVLDEEEDANPANSKVSVRSVTDNERKFLSTQICGSCSSRAEHVITLTGPSATSILYFCDEDFAENLLDNLISVDGD